MLNTLKEYRKIKTVSHLGQDFDGEDQDQFLIAPAVACGQHLHHARHRSERE